MLAALGKVSLYNYCHELVLVKAPGFSLHLAWEYFVIRRCAVRWKKTQNLSLYFDHIFWNTTIVHFFGQLRKNISFWPLCGGVLGVFKSKAGT